MRLRMFPESRVQVGAVSANVGDEGSGILTQ